MVGLGGTQPPEDNTTGSRQDAVGQEKKSEIELLTLSEP